MLGAGAGSLARVAVLAACFSFLAPGTSGLRAQTPAKGKSLSRGFHQLEFAAGADHSLRCSMWVPPLENDGTVPLVLALHWGGEVTPYFSMGFLGSLAVPGLEELGAIIVAPDCPGESWTDPISERVVLALLDYAVGNWPVDRRRIVVTGYSMGGIGTWFFASRHPEWFSAAVPVAGRPEGDGDVRVPIYAIHGKRDEVIDLEPTRRAIERLRAKGVQVELVVVKRPSHYQTREFVEPLKAAVTWLRRLWQADS
jgi:predicted peptidase